MPVKKFIALDVGEKRIGVAVGDSNVRIAIAYDTIETDGQEVKQIAELAVKQAADTIVIGYPRNQQGDPTAQTAYVEHFAGQLVDIAKVEYQDESLTSVLAEEQLKRTRKSYSKADIDMLAAALILQDYLEINYGSW